LTTPIVSIIWILLKLTYEELAEKVLLQQQEIDQRAAQIELLQQQIDWLKRQLFGGGKGEKFVDPNQALLGFNETQTAKEEPEPEVEEVSYIRQKRRKNGQANRERFDKLPVTETVEVVPEEVQANPDLYEQIGEETTFEVDIVAPKLIKRQIRRLKFRHKLDRSRPPVTAPAPVRPVQDSYASAGLIAWVALSKYLDHLPLYRQQKMFERWGAVVSRQTMSDWLRIVAFWLKPLYNLMRSDLLGGGYLQADETPVRFQDPDNKKGKTSQGYLWVIHRPGLGVVFDWRLSRRHCEATDLLDGFEGLLQSDGYEAYHALARGNDKIVHLSCWAHARRGFFNAHADTPRNAGPILEMIGRLYELEEEYRRLALSPNERLARRQAEHPAILEEIRERIDRVRGQCLPQSTLGKACAYTLARWTQLGRYVNHGEAEIDNNLVENKIRPSAIGKKNWLFIGSPEAGEKAAVIYSLLLTCEIHGVDAHAWMRDVLAKAPVTADEAGKKALLPYNWKS